MGSNKQTQTAPQDYGENILHSKSLPTKVIGHGRNSLRAINEAIDEFILANSSSQQQLQAIKASDTPEVNIFPSPLSLTFDSDAMAKQLKSHSITY